MRWLLEGFFAIGRALGNLFGGSEPKRERWRGFPNPFIDYEDKIALRDGRLVHKVNGETVYDGPYADAPESSKARLREGDMKLEKLQEQFDDMFEEK